MEKQEIEDYIKAGKIAQEVIKFARDFIKPDMLLVEIAEAIEGKIKELGGGIAFPVNLSINEIAAHYTPSANEETKAEGLLKVDLGIEVNGHIADCAFSLDLTENKRYETIIRLNEKVLENALSIIKPGIKIKEIGEAVQETINNDKFSIIKNLSGHSLGKNLIHSGLTISNYKNNNTRELKDIAVAIEPFLTEGNGEVYESVKSEIFMLEEPKPVRDKDTKELLKFIMQEYKTRPFCKRWLEKENFRKLNFSLNQLTKQKILHNFPVLVEKSKKPVSQAEHTVLILDDKVIVTTKENE